MKNIHNLISLIKPSLIRMSFKVDKTRNSFSIDSRLLVEQNRTFIVLYQQQYRKVLDDSEDCKEFIYLKKDVSEKLTEFIGQLSDKKMVSSLYSDGFMQQFFDYLCFTDEQKATILSLRGFIHDNVGQTPTQEVPLNLTICSFEQSEKELSVWYSSNKTGMFKQTYSISDPYTFTEEFFIGLFPLYINKDIVESLEHYDNKYIDYDCKYTYCETPYLTLSKHGQILYKRTFGDFESDQSLINLRQGYAFYLPYLFSDFKKALKFFDNELKKTDLRLIDKIGLRKFTKDK